MAIVSLVSGGNIGNRYKALSDANSLIEERIGDILALSSFYESEPWGFESDLPFINQAIVVSTPLSPYDVLAALKTIELDLGRTQKSKNGVYADRVVDVDIIFYDDIIIFDYPNLIIPHPHMHKRRFVLEPLNEIASKIIHPTRMVSVAALLSACVDTNVVKPAINLK